MEVSPTHTRTRDPHFGSLEWRPTSAVIPWDRNPRRLSEQDSLRLEEFIQHLRVTLEEVGGNPEDAFTAPIVLQRKSHRIIDGHLRLAAAKRLGMEMVPVRLVDVDDRTAELMAIGMNRQQELRDWDPEVLKQMVDELGEEDMAVVGWGDDELKDMFGQLDDLEEPAEDEPPPPPRNPVTKPGEVISLGDHTLVCKDCREVTYPAGIDLVLTDPPYGVQYEGKTKEKLRIQNDGQGDLDTVVSEALRHVRDFTRKGAVWYVYSPSGPLFLKFANLLNDMNVLRQTLIWVKHSMVLGHSDFHYKHEFIFYGWTPGAKHKEPPDRTQTSVWEFDRPMANRDHPTMKPIKMLAHAIEMSTRKGDLVVDPFGGSGSTLMACEQMGRACFTTEIDPRYCDVIIRRWEEHTGKKAVRHAG